MKAWIYLIVLIPVSFELMGYWNLTVVIPTIIVGEVLGDIFDKK